MTKISQWVTTMASKTPGSAMSLVGQGSFLDKPSLHMVGYMGKNPPSINAPHDGWCPVCKTKGQTQALKTYRLNFTQSIFLCTNPQCIYPLGYTPLDNIIANTADLKKNSSLKKLKKRNFSDLSSTALPCEKRPKTDLPNVGDSHTVQADLYKSVPGFPSLECGTSSPTRSHYQKEVTDACVSGTSNGTATLWDTSSFPMPAGSSSRYAPGQPDELDIVQDGHREVLQNGNLEVMDTLTNGSLLILRPETVVMVNEVDKVQEKVMEMTESVNDKPISNDLALGSDHILPYVCPPTPLLQHSQQQCQVKEDSSKEVSISPSNIDAVSELESGSSLSCELIKDGLRLVEPPKEQMENMEDLTDRDVEASCNKEGSLFIQESPIKVTGNPVPSQLQHEQSDDQQINSNSLSEISPPTCPEVPEQESSFGSAGLSESLQTLQGSCEQECPIKYCSLTDLGNPLFSQPFLVAEVSEKSQSTLPSCALEEYQTKSLSEDYRDTPMDLTTALPDRSMVSTEDPSISAPSVSLLQELAQNCQKTNGNPVPCELQHEEPDQQINSSSLLEISLPCPKASVEKSSFGSADLSESLQTLQGSCEQERPIEYCSLTDIGNPLSSQPFLVAEVSEKSQSTLPSCEIEECQTKSLSEDDQDTPMDLTTVVPDRSVVSTEDPSISAPNVSLLQELAQNCQKTNSEEHNPSVLQNILPESQVEKKAMNTCDQDTPMDLTTVLPDRSMVSTEDPSISAPNVSLLQELAQNCQKTNSQEHNPSNVLQDILPESQVEDKAMNPCESHTTSVPSVKVQAYADAAAIPLPDNPLSEKLDPINTCQKNDMDTPAESLLDNKPICSPDGDSLENACEPHSPSVSMRDDCHAKSLNKMSLLGPQILLQDCLKCHCGMNIPYPSLQRNVCDNSTTTVSSLDQDDAAAISHGTSASELRDDKTLNKMSPASLKILLRDFLKCHCGMNVPSQYLENIQTPDKNSASNVGNSLPWVRGLTDCEKDSTNSGSHQDSSTVSTVENATVTPTESPLSKQENIFFENTILPDLLLDIQLEHRMEEPVSTAPSTACDATTSVTPSDMDVTKQDVGQNGQVNESNIMETEMSIDTVQDGSKLSDTLETSLNGEGLEDDGNEAMEDDGNEAMEDDGNEAMEENDEVPAQDEKASPAKRLKPTERRLQWKNKHSLCWLDCILSALVQSETLKHFVAEGHISKESTIHNLITRYDAATEMFVKNVKKRKTDLKRPKHEKCLNQVRIEIFEKLKPLLKCKLGRLESPVFAFPLLLRLDPEIENLFMHSFMWQFKCENCGYSYQQRCQKTLTTFTKVLPEWHPLNAVHTGPCNKCQDTEQKRTMVLEQLNSVFMVHFVEGLPSSNLKEYAFQFQGHTYEVKTIIKYKKKHFSTWISNADGTWLESDDLRGSFCRRYQKFMVRADDLHIVVWERNEKSFEDNVQFVALEQDSEFNLSNVCMAPEDQSFSSMGAAELSQQVAPTVPPVALNASDPLAGMEGYAADDVITLTLVEIPLDENGLPVEATTKPQPTNTCTLLKEANQGEDTRTIPLESQEDCTFTSLSLDPNAETVPLRNCSVLLTPFKPAGEAIATSTPAPQPYNTKRSIVGNWMTRLIRKDNSILNSDPLANKKMLTLKTCPPLKVTDSSGVPKKAQNFNGFEGRSMSKMNASSNVIPSNTSSKASLNVPKETTSPTPSASAGFRVPGSSGLDYGKLLKEGSSPEDKTHKLRLKLLKKLKAKKIELATLEMLAKRHSGGSSGVGFNRKEHLRSLLKELQEQLDNADNESVCTMSSSTSICSSPGDAEFFAELFSPSPVSSQSNDSKYLEMLAEGCGAAATDHVPQDTSGSSHPCPNTSTLHNPRDESLNLMSSSALAVLNEDNSYFDFDDYF